MMAKVKKTAKKKSKKTAHKAAKKNLKKSAKKKASPVSKKKTATAKKTPAKPMPPTRGSGKAAGYQLMVTLKDVRPSVWRRILVPSHLKLADFHKVLQSAMGWTNSHLHHFQKDRNFYVPEKGEFDTPADTVYRNVQISDLLKKEKDTIIYEYDFGDGWTHMITLEKVLPSAPKVPECLDGKRACPPEDCGGPWGYAKLRQVIANPRHEEYAEMMDWLGGEFDPERFDIAETNEALRSKDFGCLTLF